MNTDTEAKLLEEIKQFYSRKNKPIKISKLQKEAHAFVNRKTKDGKKK